MSSKMWRLLGVAPLLASAQQANLMQIGGHIFDDECPDADPDVRPTWQMVNALFLEAEGEQHFAGPAYALNMKLIALEEMAKHPAALFACPHQVSILFYRCAVLASALEMPWRARVLIQLAGMFRLQATSRWYVDRQNRGLTGNARFMPRLQAELTLATTSVKERVGVPPDPNFGTKSSNKRAIEVHTICAYKPDKTSNTGDDSPLPQYARWNHESYCSLHGYNYVMHTELPLPQLEAHYSKMAVIHKRLMEEDGTFSFFKI